MWKVRRCSAKALNASAWIDPRRLRAPYTLKERDAPRDSRGGSIGVAIESWYRRGRVKPAYPGSTRVITWLAAALLALLSGPACAAGASRIGVISPPEHSSPLEQGLRQGLRELGYVEGQSIIIEWRRSSGREDELRPIAADLKRAKVEVIVVFSTPAARAALEETSAPVVFMAGDPVGMGLAASLARPAGRATGVSVLVNDLAAKRVELLRQVVPGTKRMAALINASSPMGKSQFQEMQKAAQRLGVQLLQLDIQDEARLEAALRAIDRDATDAVLVSADVFLLSNAATVARSLRRARVPALYPSRAYVDSGGLMSYGPDVRDLARRAAGYVHRILKGANPGDLPIEQAAKLELVIDLRLARELKLQIPEDVLLRADDVLR
jgi:putative ABC transport system substrate-binding protein